MTYYKANKIECAECHDIIEYTHKTKDSNPRFLIYCGCGKTAMDPAAFTPCFHVLFTNADNPPKDLSVIWEE